MPWLRMALLAGLEFVALLSGIAPVTAGTHTWDGRYDTSRIDVTVVYFVPSDRTPLADWQDRVHYYCRRIEQFHAREFTGQSVLRTIVHPEPFRSESDTAALREGDANAIYFRTLQETDRRLNFGQDRGAAFPILLVLSEINWRPLDDFYRLHPDGETLQFEGHYDGQQHFPGATSGGARAAYLADRGVGWGLVSADGWRVPYRGSDCVIYHEGCGHTVGLPHPEPADNSVMSLAQYRGWISESWLDDDQKATLGWEHAAPEPNLQTRLFNEFTAIPSPRVPQPGEPVSLELTWPVDAAVRVSSIRVRYQTDINAAWQESVSSTSDTGGASASVAVAAFDAPTPVSYRVDAVLESGESVELWGYFQVRSEADTPVLPATRRDDLSTQNATPVVEDMACTPSSQARTPVPHGGLAIDEAASSDEPLTFHLLSIPEPADPAPATQTPDERKATLRTRIQAAIDLLEKKQDRQFFNDCIDPFWLARAAAINECTVDELLDLINRKRGGRGGQDDENSFRGQCLRALKASLEMEPSWVLEGRAASFMGDDRGSHTAEFWIYFEGRWRISPET